MTVVRTTAVMILMASVPTAWAAGTHWQHDPAVPGDWHDPANWDNGLPAYRENVYVDNGGTVNIDNFGSGPDAEADDVTVGSVPGASGTINVNAGAEFNTDDDLLIGDAAGATGTFNFSGVEINNVDDIN